MLSLEGSLRTCKVDPGWASRIQSDRFENPNLMVCPVWSGFDNAGRPVCADSYYTKEAGCNTPMDRVVVENALRPQYMEYINLDAEGFRANIYKDPRSCNDPNNMFCYDSGIRTEGLDQLPTITGHFGYTPNGSQIAPRCDSYPYNVAQQQEANVAQASRQAQAVQHGFQSHQNRTASGMGR